MNNNKNNIQEFFKRNGSSIIICSSIAILLIATLYFSFNSLNKEDLEENLVVENDNPIYETVSQSDVKSYKESEDTEDKSNTSTSKVDTKEDSNTEDKTGNTTTSNKDETKDTEDNAENTTTSNKDETKDTEDETKETSLTEDNVTFSLFDDTKEMTWPVFGQIVMDYSMETAIYDKTLEQYRTNDSIAISAEEGTEVLAAAEGIVEQIYADVEDGNTIVINHGNGWVSTYSQLQDNILVAVGQIVAEGEVIGTVGKPSNYSANLGTHLDFKITKDNISTDPKLVLAEIEE